MFELAADHKLDVERPGKKVQGDALIYAVGAKPMAISFIWKLLDWRRTRAAG
jgi:hypothetical protein